MAQSTKGAGNLMVPLAVVTLVVVGLLVVTFMLTGEEPADEPTIIAEDGVEADPAGAGTTPEGEADETVEGISDQLDEVDPAAPDVDEVPPAELATEDGADPGIEGETEADEVTEGSAGEPVIENAGGSGDAAADGTATAADGDTATGDEAAAMDDDAAAETGAGTDDAGNDASTFSDEEFLLDEDSDSETGSEVVDSEQEGFPAGRDAQVELDPEPGQDVVRDPDRGGTGFIPTPSGPEGRDDETIAD